MTLVFKKHVSQKQWIDFTLAITEVFWRLPAQARPKGFNYACDLFDGETIRMFHHSRSKRARRVLPLYLSPCPQIVEQTAYWPDDKEDFFARVVLILLHNICPGHSEISLTPVNYGWELPLAWLHHHYQYPQLKAPESINERLTLAGNVSFHIQQYCLGINDVDAQAHWKMILEAQEALLSRRIAHMEKC